MRAPTVCRLVAEGAPGFAARLVALADPAGPPPPAPVPALPVAEQVRLSRLRHACPHAAPPSCGCSDVVQCGLGKGDAGQADRATCFACLAVGLVD